MDAARCRQQNEQIIKCTIHPRRKIIDEKLARVLSIVVNLPVKNLQNDQVDNQKYIIISACAVVIEIRSSIDTTLTRIVCVQNPIFLRY